MSKIFDSHSILTAVLVAAIVVLAALGKIDGTTAMAAIVAAVSPGLVLKTKSDRAVDAAVKRNDTVEISLPPIEPPDPPVDPVTKDAA
jgi:hypothetical protein